MHSVLYGMFHLWWKLFMDWREEAFSQKYLKKHHYLGADLIPEHKTLSFSRVPVGYMTKDNLLDMVLTWNVRSVALTMVVWGRVCACTMSVFQWCEGVSQVLWGKSFCCRTSMSDCTVVCNVSGFFGDFFFDEYMQMHMHIKLYRSVHPAHCQSPGPLSSVCWWQLLVHPSLHPGLRRERKEKRNFYTLEHETKKETEHWDYAMPDNNTRKKTHTLYCKNQFSSGVELTTLLWKKPIVRREQLQYPALMI